MKREEAEDEEEATETGGTLTSTLSSSKPSSCAKGRDERLQESHTNAISPPFATDALYVSIETENEHLTCVHFKQWSQEMALLALVTPLEHATHG